MSAQFVQWLRDEKGITDLCAWWGHAVESLAQADDKDPVEVFSGLFDEFSTCWATRD